MTGASKPETESARQFAAWLAALFLVVLGAKLWVIQAYGTDIPYWDQWDEAGNVFKPWVEGHLTWGALFAPHNEHRIFFTRVLDLFEIWLNGQWDPMLQMVVAAMIHAGYACGLAWCLWAFTGRRHQALICLLIIPFFALPFAAENTIHGFQSQMYFLSIFSLIAMLGLGLEKPGTMRWYGGLLAAVMALFTMGSGLLASLAVMGLMIIRGLREKRIRRDWLIIAGCAVTVFAVGLALNVTPEQSRQFRTHSPLVFIDALMRNLAWPFWDQPPLLFLAGLPLVIVFVKYLRSDLKNVRGAEFVLMLGFWGLLQSAGLAFSRSGLGNSSRYMDTLCTIPIASAAGWFVLADDIDFRPWKRRGMLMAWSGLMLFGLWLNTEKTLADYLPWSQKWGLIEEKNVRAFVSTDDTACLMHQPQMAVPYWSPEKLVELLRDPDLQKILPPACRRPMKADHQSRVAAGEIKEMGWLSPYVLKLLDHAVAILIVGFCMIVILVGGGLIALCRKGERQH